MKRFWTGLLVVLGMASLACGGGGGGSGKTCADLAAAVGDCAGGLAPADLQAQCEATVCTGSRQAVIDAVIGSTCEDMEATASEQQAAQGCRFAATCQGAAYQLSGCFDMDPAEILSGCSETSCDTPAGKAAALACVVALDCSDSVDLYSACMTENGCPDPFTG